MRTISVVLLNILLLASCTKQEAMLSSNQDKPNDSLVLNIAVMPVMDCLPIFYAKRAGMFDSLKLNVSLTTYVSMMDVDTSLIHKRVHMGYTSLPRVLEMEEKKEANLRPLIQCWGTYSLALSPKSRIKKLTELNEKLVALSRNNMGDWWSDSLMKQANMDQDAIFRPQFNDLELRLSMLEKGLVDAAVLPQPQATAARKIGCRILVQTSENMTSMNCIVCQTWQQADTLHKKQEKLFLQAYNQAVKAISSHKDTLLIHTIYKEDMRQNSSITNTLPLPKYTPANKPTIDKYIQAKAWLESRKINP